MAPDKEAEHCDGHRRERHELVAEETRLREKVAINSLMMPIAGRIMMYTATGASRTRTGVGRAPGRRRARGSKSRGGTRVPPRHFRPRARRRPGALPTSFLVLLSPRGVHHGAALHGCSERNHQHLFAQGRIRLRLRRVLQRVHCGSRLPGLGPPPFRQRHEPLRRHDLQLPELLRRHPVGYQSLQLDGDPL